MIPYTLTSSSLTVLINGLPKVVDKTHANFKSIIEAVQEGDVDKVIKLSDVSTSINTFGNSKIVVKNGNVYYKDTLLENYGVDKVLEFMELDLPVEPIIKFLDNLMDNPSYRAVKELYKFLEVGQMPLTDDGNFLCYKKVDRNFKDIHSGTFDNSVGSICEMPRNMVDEDSSRTCSAGLHACSFSYLKHFGGSPDNKVVVVKINPRDVVSIPSDYHDSKLRCSRYEVVQDVTDSYYKSMNVLVEKPLVTTQCTKNTIQQYDLQGNKLAQFKDAQHIEAITGIWSQNTRACCNGSRATAGGYKWSWIK